MTERAQAWRNALLAGAFFGLAFGRGAGELLHECLQGLGVAFGNFEEVFIGGGMPMAPDLGRAQCCHSPERSRAMRSSMGGWVLAKRAMAPPRPENGLAM